MFTWLARADPTWRHNNDTSYKAQKVTIKESAGAQESVSKQR